MDAQMAAPGRRLASSALQVLGVTSQFSLAASRAGAHQGRARAGEFRAGIERASDAASQLPAAED